MKRMLINAAQAEELRVALVHNHTLYDLIVERAGFEQKVGNIYKAKITSIEPSLDAVFVDYGSERHGFLPAKEIAPENFRKQVDSYVSSRHDIRDLLRVGQELIIQVEKEERGNKGAALTTFISLAGSYLVLMPNNPRAGGISRRIEGDDRDELRESLSEIQVPSDMGLIVRTAGVGKSRDELQWDLDVLLSHWTAIQTAVEGRSAPFLIHQEGDLVIRAIRDYLRADISELLIDSKEVFEKAKNYIKQVRPDFVERIKFYESSTPLFTQFEIEHQIETAYKRTVQLPSGGSLVIDHTEALVAIDINSAGSTKADSIEATALHTNLEAAEEIARQLRLRDIGGLIVIDFIDMMQAKHQREVENALHNGLRLDRARVQISKISRFGLLELSRQRLRPSLREAIQNVCPTCNGHGSVRSVESIALTILRIIEEEAMKPNTSEIEVQASSDTATYLLNEKRHFLQNLEQNHRTNIFIIPNPNYQPHQYNIKRLRRTDSEAGEKHKPSYDHLQSPDVDFSASRQAHERQPQDQPAVKNVLPTRPISTEKHPTGGLIKRLWSTMFGAEEEARMVSYEEAPQKQRPDKTTRQRSTRESRDTRGSKDETDRRTRRSTSDKSKTDTRAKRSKRPTREDRQDKRRTSDRRRKSTAESKSDDTQKRPTTRADQTTRQSTKDTRDTSKRRPGRRRTTKPTEQKQPTQEMDQPELHVKPLEQEKDTTAKASTPQAAAKKETAGKEAAPRRPRRVKGPKDSTTSKPKSEKPSKDESQSNKSKEGKMPENKTDLGKFEQQPTIEKYEQEQTFVKPLSTSAEPSDEEPLVVIRPKPSVASQKEAMKSPEKSPEKSAQKPADKSGQKEPELRVKFDVTPEEKQEKDDNNTKNEEKTPETTEDNNS